MIIKTRLTNTNDFANQRQLQWLHLKDPTETEMHQVLTEYDFPADFITNALDPYEVSRTEEYTNKKGEKVRLHIFLYPLKDEAADIKDQYRVASLSMIEFKTCVVTACRDDIPFISELQDKSAIAIDGQLTPFTFTMSLFWKISQHYIDILTEMNEKIYDLETEVTYSTSNDILYQLIGLNKGLIYFASAIEGNQMILEHLEMELKEEDSVHGSDDILIRMNRIEQHQASVMIKNSQILIEKLSSMLSYVISNNMNQIMKILTSFTIILTIPTIVGGMWG